MTTAQEYTPLLEKCLAAKASIDKAIEILKNAEAVNSETDNTLIELLENLQGQTLDALDNIPKWQQYSS